MAIPQIPVVLKAVAILEAASFVLFVFCNWQDKRAIENHPMVDVEAWKFWSQFGHYSFLVLSILWLFGIGYAVRCHLVLRRQGMFDNAQDALRTSIGFAFFPPFIAVIAYLPVYVVINLLYALKTAVLA